MRYGHFVLIDGDDWVKMGQKNENACMQICKLLDGWAILPPLYIFFAIWGGGGNYE